MNEKTFHSTLKTTDEISKYESSWVVDGRNFLANIISYKSSYHSQEISSIFFLEFSFLTEPAAKEFGNLSTAGSERKEFRHLTTQQLLFLGVNLLSREGNSQEGVDTVCRRIRCWAAFQALFTAQQQVLQ